MFGKMLKYKGIGCVILECGASGLTVGGEITQEAKKVCDEGRENITTLTNHNSCAGPISHHYNFKILIYLHNICLLSRFENIQYIKKTNCTSNICLFGDERGDGSKRATASLSFPTARHSKLPESEGQYEQAGRAATSWELFLLVVVGGLTCWLPFFITAWCLIHPNLSHYGRTRAPLVIRDSGGGTLYQPMLHCCRAEELCLSSFLFQSRPVQIKKLQTKLTRMKKQYFARLTPATFVDPLCVLRL